ncbi:MAG: hypothetical protein QGG48_10965, partial [Desulfatiglandales bacterium]|nr:hypothetical protein [Desulfatiglandales bacterium]
MVTVLLQFTYQIRQVFPYIPNPRPNWKHGNAAACGEAFACPAAHLQLTKSRFHQALIPAEPAVIRQSW